MARRKDHSPEDLKALIRTAAEKLIHTKGLKGLTARALAAKIGYTPGTIYNFYRDMNALVTEVNYATLKQLHDYCLGRVDSAKPGFERIKVLAHAYIDFACTHERAWRTLFIVTGPATRSAKLPTHYRQRLDDLFGMIETTLQKNLDISAADAAQAARLLWSCLHGITSLTLEGRLDRLGLQEPYAMADDLLGKYLKEYVRR